MGFGNRLDQLMKESGTNANELASRAGVTASTIYSMIQRDSNRVDIDLVIKLSHAMGVTADELLKDELDGQSSDIVLTGEERSLVIAYRMSSSEIKTAACAVLGVKREPSQDADILDA